LTAAERFGSGDLRPVTTGSMPREFQVLADAMRQMGNACGIVSESSLADKIAASASDPVRREPGVGRVFEPVPRHARDRERCGESAHELNSTQSGWTARRQPLRLPTPQPASHDWAKRRTVRDRHRNDIAAASNTLLDVRKSVRTTGTEVTQLAEQSSAIDDFVDLIKRISSQTNLLALNAAIRSRAHRRAWPGLRGRRGRSAPACRRIGTRAEDVARTRA